MNRLRFWFDPKREKNRTEPDLQTLVRPSLPVAPLIFGFVYFTNQPQDSYIFSFAACPKISRRPPCLWLYRRPTISFVFDTLRFILQFQVCLSSPPGSAPG